MTNQPKLALFSNFSGFAFDLTFFLLLGVWCMAISAINPIHNIFSAQPPTNNLFLEE
jgi:hypothetical protein